MSKAGRKIMANLKKEYGDKKGEGIFYAMENKGEIPGMNKMKGYAKGGDTKKKKKDVKSKTDRDEQMDKARSADRMRRQLEERDSRSERQEAQYQEEQQARRERGGLSRLAMLPEAVRRAQVRALDRLIAPSEERETAPMRARAAEAEREFTDSLSQMNKGGMAKKKRMAKGGAVKSYNKGGMVKATGKLNTGIKKCGE
jgi:hypothetical protein